MFSLIFNFFVFKMTLDSKQSIIVIYLFIFVLYSIAHYQAFF